MDESCKMMMSGFDHYQSKNEHHRQFQIDVAMSLMKYAIELDWQDPSDNTTKPRWIPLVPCDCGNVFCCNNMMTGIDHRVPGHPAL